MDNIGDDGSYFDPDEKGGENGRHNDEDAGLPVQFVPIPAGAKHHYKSDPFQSDLARLISAIKSTLPQRYCFLEPTRQIFDIIGEMMVCGLLRVVAHLHDTEGDHWHYLIEFADRSGSVKEILISAEELDLHANALSRRLARKGRSPARHRNNPVASPGPELGACGRLDPGSPYGLLGTDGLGLRCLAPCGRGLARSLPPRCLSARRRSRGQCGCLG